MQKGGKRVVKGARKERREVGGEEEEEEEEREWEIDQIMRGN